MKLFDHIMCVFDDASRQKWASALMNACIAIDATSKALYPSMIGSANRYKRCIREYYWLIEPMMGVGINLVDTRFTNVTCIRNNHAPDFADLIYHILRCSHAHGDEVPENFSIIGSDNAYASNWHFAPNSVRMPDKVLWALTSVAVFSRVNSHLIGMGSPCRLSWGAEIYPVAEWWGREADIKLLASGWNTQRIEIKELVRLNEADPTTAATFNLLSIAPAPGQTASDDTVYASPL